MRNILITGGAGFIGSCLAEKLTGNPDNYVVIVDNLLTGSKQKLPAADRKNWKFIKGDCNNYRDISQIMLTYHFDYVFHYAAMVGVERTQENPYSVLRDVDGFRYIFNICKNSDVKKVFFSSSSEVYGEPVNFPQNEHTTPLNSRVPYAVVKNLGESYLRSYQKEFGLDYTIFRFFNTYGPKQSKDFVISKFIAKALKGEPITIYGDGSQTRTFCFVDDTIEACVSAFENGCGHNDVINVGNDNEISILELAHKIVQMTGSRSEIVHLPPLQEGDMTRRLPDITKMRSILQRELTSLEEGIKKILADTSYIL